MKSHKQIIDEAKKYLEYHDQNLHGETVYQDKYVFAVIDMALSIKDAEIKQAILKLLRFRHTEVDGMVPDGNGYWVDYEDLKKLFGGKA